MPQEEEEAFGSRRGFRGRASAASSTVANLFEGHSMVQQHMVRGCPAVLEHGAGVCECIRGSCEVRV